MTPTLTLAKAPRSTYHQAMTVGVANDYDGDYDGTVFRAATAISYDEIDSGDDCDDDESGRIFVPQDKRQDLIKLTHGRMLHLGHRIIHSHLAQWYWWPHMFRDVKVYLQACKFCQLAEQKRRLSHKQFRFIATQHPPYTVGI